MPIHEYRCGHCGSQVEALVLAGREEPRCPQCGMRLEERLISAPNILSGATRREAGRTCCGRQERCDTPACSSGGPCRHEA